MQTREKRSSPAARIALFVLTLALICGAALIARRAAADAQTQPAEESGTEENGTQQGAALTENGYDLSAFSMQDGFMTYSGDGTVYAGVDVSQHQGAIDWQRVKDAGVDFAIIRVGNRGTSEGAISLDEQFKDNMAGAAAAGIDIGVYFFSQAVTEDEAREEAHFVLTWIENYDLKYPVYYDWEDVAWEARTDGMDPVTLTACAKAFCGEIAAAGYRAGLYFNQRFGYQEFNLSELQEYTFWLASYSATPDFRYHFDVWQYSAEGAVDGIDGAVDLNLSFTDFRPEE